MGFIISEENNIDIMKLYAEALAPATLINTGNVEYVDIESTSLNNTLLGVWKEYLTNDKVHPHISCLLTYEDGLKSDKLTLYGQYVLGNMKGIVFDGSDNHITDLINASFFAMQRDPSLSMAMLAAVSLLSRVYSEDLPVYIGAKEYKGVTGYVL